MPVDEIQLAAEVDRIRNRRPVVGLAVGTVRGGALESFHGAGLADIATGTPVTEDTVFRIASVTKTFTAVAVLQLWERGLVDLDAPVGAYLRAYRLVPAKAGFRPVTLRHLLTHTAGIREVLHPSGLLRMRDLGETVPAGRPVPSLAEFYGGRLRVDVQPGTSFAYTNHGFATLGQIVEDVSGEPLDRYFREHIFAPLGMTSTDLACSGRLATGYELRARGPVPITGYEVVTVGGGAVLSSPRDMARYVAALLGGGGAVLAPGTVATMTAPQYQPDPRIPGMGLAFFRGELGGHRTVEHDGVLPGFDAQILLAPAAGVAVLAFANGAKRGMHWLGPETANLMRRLLGVPAATVRTDLPQRPETWGDLCGWYRFTAHRTDPARLAVGPAVQVVVRRGELVIRALSPIPALRRGFVLHPDDDRDPEVFRIELPWFGIGTGRVVFSRPPGTGRTAIYLDFAPLSFVQG
ncbi:serine hydrolase domain-containing protein [Actinoplanes sp. NPDC049599]|uniref:serine hydrolase domain-containing protein n=1 Tax=Actinoplanes sp. NPDC049599 TaxID=3363903 RepID=UPI0037AF520B